MQLWIASLCVVIMFAASLNKVRAFAVNRGAVGRFQMVKMHMHQQIPQQQGEVLRSSGIKWAKNALKVAAVAPFLVAMASATADDTKPSAGSGSGFTTTESGLQYRDLVVGTGASPVPGDTVRVHYTGWLDEFDSSKKFDSSYDRRSPLSFKVGARQVIAGWDEGILTNLKVGGKRELIIPASLGYGRRGAGGVIPPNATLYFRIELVGIGAR